MDMEQIRCVLAVVRYKTFLEASFQLHRSQSSVSKSILRLEEELGVDLFERTTRNVALTDAGRDFVAYAEQIDNAYEGILDSVKRHLHNGTNKLRIGSIYFGMNNLLAPLIARFLKFHPTMEIEVKEDTTVPLLQALHRHDLDVVFVSSMYTQGEENASFAANREYRSFPCFYNLYYVIVSKTHPFADRTSLRYEDLAGESFITTDRAMDVYHKALHKVFDAHGVPLNIVMYCTNVRSVLHMVSQNLGIAILSDLVIEESDDFRIIPLENALIRETQMLILNERTIQPHIRVFSRFIVDQISLMQM